MDTKGVGPDFHFSSAGGQESEASGGLGSPAERLPEAPTQPLVEWTASEFVDHKKGALWFVPFVLVVIAAAAVVYLVSRGILAPIVVVLGGVAFATLAYQKPRTLTYRLFPTTIKVGLKSYSYNDFRTFSVIQEGGLFSVLLEPVKRFMPSLSIYFAPEDGERIFNVLATHIPHQDRQADPLERLMRKIRF